MLRAWGNHRRDIEPNRLAYTGVLGGRSTKRKEGPVTTLAYRKAHAARRAVVPAAGLIAAGLLAAGCGTAGDSGGTATPGGGTGSNSSAPGS